MAVYRLECGVICQRQKTKGILMTTESGIVPVIAVKDDYELLAANITYHLNIGVKGIVVCVIPSRGDPSKILDAFSDNPQVKIMTAPSQDWEVFDWRKHMVDVAIEVFNPEFITHIDPDEFLYTPNFDHLSHLDLGADCKLLNRYNCISSMSSEFTFPVGMRDCDAMIIVRFPLRGIEHESKINHEATWLYTAVAPKIIARARMLERFTGGSHSAMKKNGEEFGATISNSLFLLHFPFSSFQRFRQKVENLSELIKLLKGRSEEGYAFHWKRWVDLQTNGGDEAIKAEFYKQIAAVSDIRFYHYLASATAVAPNGPSNFSSKEMMKVFCK